MFFPLPTTLFSRPIPLASSVPSFAPQFKYHRDSKDLPMSATQFFRNQPTPLDPTSQNSPQNPTPSPIQSAAPLRTKCSYNLLALYRLAFSKNPSRKTTPSTTYAQSSSSGGRAAERAELAGARTSQNK